MADPDRIAAFNRSVDRMAGLQAPDPKPEGTDPALQTAAQLVCLGRESRIAASPEQRDAWAQAAARQGSRPGRKLWVSFSTWGPRVAAAAGILALALLSIYMIRQQAARHVSPAPARPAYSEPLPQGAVRRLGRGVLTTMALSPDGAHLALGSYLGVYLFDARTFQQLWFQPTARQVRQIAFRPDGQALAVVQEGGAVTLRSAADGAALLELDQPPGMLVGQVSWSPNGRRLASGAPDGTAALWDARTGKQDRVLQSPVQTESVPFTETTWSPDGSRVITHTLGQVRVWDSTNGQKVSEFNLNKAQTFGLLISPNRPWLIVNSMGDSQIDLWNWQTGQIEHSLKLLAGQGGLSALGWSADGKRVFGSTYDPPQVLTWDVDTQELVEPPLPYATGAVFSPDASTVYTSGPFGVQALSASNGEKLRSLADLYPTNFTGAVYRMTWDSQGIVTGQAGLTLWDLTDGQARPLFSEDLKDPRTFAAWSTPRADGGRDFLVYKSDRTAWIRRGEREWQIATVPDSMAEFSWSPDGRWIASGETVWDVESGHVLSEFLGPRHFANLPAWSPDSQRLASGTVDGTVAVWDPLTGEVKLTLEPGILWVPQVAWSPDGKLLAVMGNANDNTGDPPTDAWIYDAQTGAVIHSWEGPGGHTQGLAWSPDGRWLAAGKSSGEVRVWDTATWQEVHNFQGHRDQVITIAWSPDSTRLASGGLDGQILIWAVGDAPPVRSTPTPAPTPAALVTPLPGGTGINVASAPQVKQSQVWGKGAVHGVTYAQDGRQIAVLSTQGLALLDSSTRQETDFFPTEGISAHYFAAGISPDWNMVAIGRGAGIDLLRREDHQLLRTLNQDAGTVDDLYFTRDSSLLVGLVSHPGSEEYSWTALVWQVSDGALVSRWGPIPWATNPGQMRPSFSASGELAVFWKYPDPSGIQIVNLTSGDLDWALSPADAPASAAVSTDEKTIAVLNQDGRIDLFSLESRSLLRSMQTGMRVQSSVTFLTFSQDDTLLVGGNGDGKVFVWQVSDGQLLRTFQADPLAYTMALSPDGSVLALNTLETVHFWSLADGSLLGALEGYTLPVQAIAVSPAGDRVVSLVQGGDHTPLTLWQTGQAAPLWSSADHSALSLAFSPDGGQLALGMWDGSVRLVSADSGGALADLRVQPDPSAQIRCLAYAPGGGQLASASMGVVHVWDLAGSSLLRTLTVSDGWVDSVDYSPDSRYLAASAADGGIWLWTASHGEVIAKWMVDGNGHTGQLAFTPDSRTLAFAVDSAVYSWPVDDPQVQHRLDLGSAAAQGLAFSPSGDVLAVALENGVIQLLSFPNGAPLASLSGHTGGVSSLAFSADGSSLFTGSYDGTVRLWRVP